MNIQQILQIARVQLAAKYPANPSLEAELLLSFVIQKKREFFFAHPEAKINFWQKLKFHRLIKKRLKNIPLAYLIGSKEFYGFNFKVNKNVLIPRPETELIIDEVIKLSKQVKINNFIDIGTGTGAIIITLFKKIKQGNFIGIDVSKKALKIALKNSRLHDTGKIINFHQSNLLKNIDFKKILGPTLITANLPYLTPQQVKNSPSIQKEPLLALDGGSDGLDYYRQLFEELKIVRQTAYPLFIFCEIDETQSRAISQLIKINFPEESLEIKKDLNGLDRLVILTLN